MNLKINLIVRENLSFASENHSSLPPSFPFIYHPGSRPHDHDHRHDAKRLLRYWILPGSAWPFLKIRTYPFSFTENGNLEEIRQSFESRNIHAVCVIEETENHVPEMYSTGQVDSDIQGIFHAR